MKRIIQVVAIMMISLILFTTNVHAQNPASQNTLLKYQVDTTYVVGKTPQNPIYHTAEDVTLKALCDYVLFIHKYDSLNLVQTIISPDNSCVVTGSAGIYSITVNVNHPFTWTRLHTFDSINVPSGDYYFYNNMPIAYAVGISNYFFGNSGNSSATGIQNTALGDSALHSITVGNYNSAFGNYALYSLTTGSLNIGDGFYALKNLTNGTRNIGIGFEAGAYTANGSTPNTSSTNSIFLGSYAYPLGSTDINEIVIGDTAIGSGSNTATVGNSAITKTILRGAITDTTITTTSSYNDSVAYWENNILKKGRPVPDITKNNANPLYNWNIDGSVPIRTNYPYSTWFTAVMPIGIDSFIRISIIDTTGSAENSKYNKIYESYNYNGGLSSGWTTPVLIFPPMGTDSAYAGLGWGKVGNTLTLFFGVEQASRPGYYRTYKTYSTDNGATWAAKDSFGTNFFSPISDTMNLCYGEVISIAGGQNGTAIYGQKDAAGHQHVVEFITTPDGINWFNTSVINQTKSLNESTLKYSGNNRILCLARGASNGSLEQLQSSDNGSTWTDIGTTNMGLITGTTSTNETSVSPLFVQNSLVDSSAVVITTMRGSNFYNSLNSFIRPYGDSISEIWNNPNNWLKIGTQLPRPFPQNNTVLFGYTTAFILNDSTIGFIYGEKVPLQANKSNGVFDTIGNLGVSFTGCLRYRTTIKNDNPIVGGYGKLTNDPLTNSQNWLVQDGRTWTFDPFTQLSFNYSTGAPLFAKFSQNGATDIQGNILMNNGIGEYKPGSINGGAGISVALSTVTATPSLTFSLTATGVTPGSIGSASTTVTGYVNSFGQYTTVATVPIAIGVPQINISGSPVSGSYLDYTGSWSIPSGSGSVGSFSFTPSNGFGGVVTNPTTNPVLTMSTTVTGLIKGSGGALTAATAADLTGTVTVTNGGTGLSSLTAHGILIGEGSSNVTSLVQSSNGFLLNSSAGADPTWTAAAVLNTSLQVPIVLGTSSSLPNVRIGGTYTSSVANMSGVSLGANYDLSGPLTYTATSGKFEGVLVYTKYAEASGTAANYDLFVMRNQTGGVGSGAQRLASFGVGTTIATYTPKMDIDTQGNISCNNVTPSYTMIPTSVQTVTATLNTAYTTNFTGTTTATYQLPVTSTLPLNFPLQIFNNSTGSVTIVSSGGNTVQTMAPGSIAAVTCVSVTGTSNTSWNTMYRLFKPTGHTIFTPTTGSTVQLNDNQYNIINPAGSLLAVTLNLPASPNDNDYVEIKFTQTITTVTYTGGTVVDGITAPSAGGYTKLVYDSGTSSWY